jgi:hypothetical protein
MKGYCRTFHSALVQITDAGSILSKLLKDDLWGYYSSSAASWVLRLHTSCQHGLSLRPTAAAAALNLPAGTTPYTRVGQRNETITKGNEILIQTIYLMHEIDETTTLIRANRLAAKDGEKYHTCK